MNLILHRLLETQDLEIWSRLQKEFFEPPYTEIYYLINRFYKKFDRIPSFEELEVVTRDEKQANYISALKEVEVPDSLDTEIILEALVNEYAQRELLQKLSQYLDEIEYKDVAEIVEDLSAIAIEIEEKTEISEQIVTMNDYLTIDKDDIFSRVALGLNNDFDARSLGLALSEMIMLGGYRGSGKSVVCANIACTQYLQGNSALYFSIEMNGRELYNRYMAILAGIPEKHIKAGKLTKEEELAIAEVRSKMVKDGEELLEFYNKYQDFTDFERRCIERPLKEKNQIITIDNSNLTIPNIDATIHSYKTRFEDNLKVVIVDYINQITAHDPYSWTTQIELSKKLKALARKYEIIMVAPFQTSEEGKVRFAKGILDSPNWAFNMNAVHEGDYGGIEFECKKARGDEHIDFASEIHWPTLTILPHKNREFMNKKVTKRKSSAPDTPKEESEDDLRV